MRTGRQSRSPGCVFPHLSYSQSRMELIYSRSGIPHPPRDFQMPVSLSERVAQQIKTGVTEVLLSLVAGTLASAVLLYLWERTN